MIQNFAWEKNEETSNRKICKQTSGTWRMYLAYPGISHSKFQFSVRVIERDYLMIGICDKNHPKNTYFGQKKGIGWSWYSQGQKDKSSFLLSHTHNHSSSPIKGVFNAGSIVHCYVDKSAKTISFSRNNEGKTVLYRNVTFPSVLHISVCFINKCTVELASFNGQIAQLEAFQPRMQASNIFQSLKWESNQERNNPKICRQETGSWRLYFAYPGIQSQKFQFSVKVIHRDFLMIGVVDPNHPKNTYFGQKNGKGWSWYSQKSSSFLLSHDKNHISSPIKGVFEAGDYVHCYIDKLAGTISFSKNRENRVVFYRNVKFPQMMHICLCFINSCSAELVGFSDLSGGGGRVHPTMPTMPKQILPVCNDPKFTNMRWESNEERNNPKICSQTDGSWRLYFVQPEINSTQFRFSIRIIKRDFLMIGVVDKFHPKNTYFGQKNGKGWSWYSQAKDSYLLSHTHNHAASPIKGTFDAGDVVHCFVDKNARTVSFSKNSGNLTVFYRNVNFPPILNITVCFINGCSIELVAFNDMGSPPVYGGGFLAGERNIFPTLKWESNSEKNNPKICTQSDGTFRMYFCYPAIRSAKFQFSIKVINRDYLMLGVADKNHPKNTYYGQKGGKGWSWYSQEKNSYTLSHDNNHGATPIKGTFDAGDIVHVYIDKSARTISFSKNSGGKQIFYRNVGFPEVLHICMCCINKCSVELIAFGELGTKVDHNRIRMEKERKRLELERQNQLMEEKRKGEEEKFRGELELQKKREMQILNQKKREELEYQQRLKEKEEEIRKLKEEKGSNSGGGGGSGENLKQFLERINLGILFEKFQSDHVVLADLEFMEDGDLKEYVPKAFRRKRLMNEIQKKFGGGGDDDSDLLVC